MRTPWLATAKVCVFAAPLALLLVTDALYYPFITAKAVYFRAVVQIGVFAFVIHLLGESGGPERAALRETVRRPLFLSAVVFGLVYLLACATSLYPGYSFWSNFERGEGGVQMVHYVAGFALTALILRTRQDWLRYSAWFVALSVPVSLFGVGQRWVGGAWFYPQEPRVGGTLGNPLYLGAFVFFVLYHAGRLALEIPRRPVRILLGIVAGFQLFALFALSQSRACIAGLGAGAVAGLAVLAFQRRDGPRLGRLPVRTLAAGTLAAVVALSGLFFATWRSPLWSRVPGLARFSESSAGFFGGARARSWVWAGGWESFRDRPLLGWGPETFTAALDGHYDPRLFEVGEPWFDRAHSIYLEYLTGGGVVLLAAYLAIWACAAVELWRRRRSLGSPKLALAAGLTAAYLVQGLTAFEVLSLYVPLFGFFALLLRDGRSDDAPAGPEPAPPAAWIRLAVPGVLGLLLVGTMIFANVLPARLAARLGRAQALRDDAAELQLFLGSGGILGHPSPAGREEAAHEFTRFVLEAFVRRGGDRRNSKHERAVAGLASRSLEVVEGLDRGFMRAPNLRSLFWCAALHVEAAEMLDSLPMLETADRLMREGARRAPRRLEFHLGLVEVALLRRDRELGRRALEDVRRLSPNLPKLKRLERDLEELTAP